jgi:hypothetical protein
VNKKLIIGILVAGALGATVAYYRHRILVNGYLVPVDGPRDHSDKTFASAEEFDEYLVSDDYREDLRAEISALDERKAHG